ncbi:MAG: AAA family ATPase [Candidatus Nanoarchaeia archaeon]|jgi:2-phosphoglycerate kinase
MKKIILIGGSPTAGKSYTARKLAEQLKLPWISTDTIRDQMRSIVRKEDYPELFHHAKATTEMAVEFLTGNTAEDIVKHQNKESIDVWKGVKAIIETDYVWESFIIEGVAILPCFAAELSKKNKHIKSIFLIDEDIASVRKKIFTRGLWDDANKYPDKIKEKEVEWVIAFNNYIKDEAKRYKLPVVSVGNHKDYFREVKKLI